jgi:hypothetical protein
MTRDEAEGRDGGRIKDGSLYHCQVLACMWQTSEYSIHLRIGA